MNEKLEIVKVQVKGPFPKTFRLPKFFNSYQFKAEMFVSVQEK